MKTFLHIFSCAALLALNSLVQAGTVKEISWPDLVPEGAPPPPPPIPLHDFSQLGNALIEEYGPATPQQLPAQPVVESLNNQYVKIPGYIVPLDMSEEGRVIEFLLVPYYGACIHVPPPPSNQIIHAITELGIRVDALYQPYWIEGTMSVEKRVSELAETGYAIEAERIYAYSLE